MPEGVEVKISAELIKPLVIGRQVRRIEVGKSSRYAGELPKGYIDFEKSFIDKTGTINIISDCTITDVQVKGKFMYWTFSNGWYMFCTFGMTGQWSPEPGKHVCFRINMIPYDATGDRSDVYFNDPRHFGTIQFTNNKSDLTKKLNDLGWDPLQDKLDDYLPFLISKLKQSIKPISELLMNQTLFAGVGNYIRAEALYLAKMSPWRQSNLMKDHEIRTLCSAILDVMNESYQHQGATIQTYKTPYGAEGKYSSCFKVYGKKTDPLGNKITKQNSPDGRTIHWCSAVQV